MEIGGRLKKKKKRNGNGTQERRVIRDRHTATRIKEFHAFLFFFFFVRLSSTSKKIQGMKEKNRRRKR